MGEKNIIKVPQALKRALKKRENAVFTFFIDKDFPAFKGHFPQAPLLPGIVQTEIALFCIKQMINKDISVCEIKKAKFVKPILPDSEIFVSVNENGENYSVVIKDAKDIHSQISMRIG